MTTTDTPALLEDVRRYVSALPAQKLVVRAVAEHRPSTQPNGVVLVAQQCFVDVVTVAQGERVARRFEDVTGPAVTALAKAAGHTVVERTGNIT